MMAAALEAIIFSHFTGLNSAALALSLGEGWNAGAVGRSFFSPHNITVPGHARSGRRARLVDMNWDAPIGSKHDLVYYIIENRRTLLHYKFVVRHEIDNTS